MTINDDDFNALVVESEALAKALQRFSEFHVSRPGLPSIEALPIAVRLMGVALLENVTALDAQRHASDPASN